MIDTIQSEILHPRFGPFRPQPPEAEPHSHGRHGAAGLGARRDVLDIPERFSPSAVEESDEGGEVRRGRNGNALEGFRGLVQSAVNAIRHDLGQVLKGLGFDSEVANQFAKSFIEPVVAAIKAGVSFTAELSFAAIVQETEITGSSFRQSTSVVARSLEISVNQETGEVSLSLASLSFEEDISAITGSGTGNGEPPLLTLGPGPVTPPPEETGVAPVNPLDPLLNALLPALDGEENGETGADPVAALLGDLRSNLIESAYSFQAIIAIQLISFTTNQANQPITNIVFDVALPLDQLEYVLPEASDPVDVTA
jgi:hypothetical protein